ncbi:Energy-coupling factor transporter ATP-binding protein EcfA2 [Marinibacterium anthonyi]|nr:Energy-coupling factor transporter ATP-binding protein EcfA2 [Marinibacterium anthonyi]
MTGPILELENVRFGYTAEQPVLSDISMQIRPGEVVAIVGRNGAGKSTMLRLLNGLLRPDAGTVRVAGRDASDMKVSQIAAHVGTVFQAPEQQIFNATVESEIGFGPAQADLDEATRAKRVADAVARTGLGEVLQSHPLDLDASMRRFVAVASVLACEPGLLLLDEAQRGLDAIRREMLGRIIAEETAAGRSIALVCHDMDFVARHASRVLGLADGRMAVDAPVRDFFADAAATRAVSVEQPGIVDLSQRLNLPLALNARDLADGLAPRLKGGA